MKKTLIPAHPKKLRDGSWGAKAETNSIAAGDTVWVTTKSGKRWEARVAAVLWTGDGVAIVRTERMGSGGGGGGSSSRRSKRSCRRCGCADPTCGGKGICQGPSFDPCHDCW